MMFRALSSSTRVAMLKMLLKKEMHISGLAAELGISVPVAAKHITILEKGGLIERRKFGRTHVLKAKKEKLYGILDIFSESPTVKLPKGSSLLDALKSVSAIDVIKIGDKEFITSIDGEKGYYIYEVDGEYPNIPINDYKLRKSIQIKLKKLVAVAEKEIAIKVI